MNRFWEGVDSGLWREAFAQPEIDQLLDEHLAVLLDHESSSDELAAARGSIETVLRLQSLPNLIVSQRNHTPPHVQSAQSWRQRLLSIVRTRFQSA